MKDTRLELKIIKYHALAFGVGVNFGFWQQSLHAGLFAFLIVISVFYFLEDYR